MITADKQTFTLRLPCKTYYDRPNSGAVPGAITVVNTTGFTIPKTATITVRLARPGRYPWVETMVKQASTVFVAFNGDVFPPGAQGVVLTVRNVRSCAATVTMPRPYTR